MNDLDSILKTYIAEHADGFFGGGKPEDAVRICNKAKAQIQALIVEARVDELKKFKAAYATELSVYAYDGLTAQIKALNTLVEGEL